MLVVIKVTMEKCRCILTYFIEGELPKYTQDKWLRSRSNRGSLSMMAAAVAQVVVGQVVIRGECVA